MARTNGEELFSDATSQAGLWRDNEETPGRKDGAPRRKSICGGKKCATNPSEIPTAIEGRGAGGAWDERHYPWHWQTAINRRPSSRQCSVYFPPAKKVPICPARIVLLERCVGAALSPASTRRSSFGADRRKGVRPRTPCESTASRDEKVQAVGLALAEIEMPKYPSEGGDPAPSALHIADGLLADRSLLIIPAYFHRRLEEANSLFRVTIQCIERSARKYAGGIHVLEDRSEGYLPLGGDKLLRGEMPRMGPGRGGKNRPRACRRSRGQWYRFGTAGGGRSGGRSGTGHGEATGGVRRGEGKGGRDSRKVRGRGREEEEEEEEEEERRRRGELERSAGRNYRGLFLCLRAPRDPRGVANASDHYSDARFLSGGVRSWKKKSEERSKSAEPRSIFGRRLAPSHYGIKVERPFVFLREDQISWRVMWEDGRGGWARASAPRADPMAILEAREPLALRRYRESWHGSRRAGVQFKKVAAARQRRAKARRAATLSNRRDLPDPEQYAMEARDAYRGPSKEFTDDGRGTSPIPDPASRLLPDRTRSISKILQRSR
ncbi:hypothetical protein KM043_007201 [Ampulex compressa]|nr:hypothetical protein KM043_007201 [Ampulex compressa]